MTDGLMWDGRNVWPLLTGEETSPRPRTFYFKRGKSSALRHGDWKLVESAGGDRELFNLANDPNEMTNLATQQPDRVEQLAALLQQQRVMDGSSLKRAP
jgi:arylsulfatase